MPSSRTLKSAARKLSGGGNRRSSRAGRDADYQDHIDFGRFDELGGRGEKLSYPEFRRRIRNPLSKRKSPTKAKRKPTRARGR